MRPISLRVAPSVYENSYIKFPYKVGLVQWGAILTEEELLKINLQLYLEAGWFLFGVTTTQNAVGLDSGHTLVYYRPLTREEEREYKINRSRVKK